MEKVWENLNLRSGKWSNYFYVYEMELKRYESKDFTLLEVGVKDGGSIEYWKKTFPRARVIGIDLNPNCLTLNRDFDVYLGDQADPSFWRSLYAQLGTVNVVIDDGGHSYHQQIQTVESAIEHIQEGLVIVEDSHSSFLQDFNPSGSYTFMEYANSIAHQLTLRSYTNDPDRFQFVPVLENMTKYRNVVRVSFYQNIVVFELSKKYGEKPGVEILNNGKSSDISDFRYEGIQQSYVPKFSHSFEKTLVLTPQIQVNENALFAKLRKLRNIVRVWFAKSHRQQLKNL